MVILWAFVLVAGVTVSGFASDKALRAAESLGQRIGLSPFIIGLTIVSIGTDLPEIANSISAAAQGRGDLNVGDSTGSAATQITFVMGVLCFLAPVKTHRSFVASTGSLTVGALLLGAALMSDGEISRLDGGVLILLWVASTLLVARTQRTPRTAQPQLFQAGVGTLALRTFAALAAVAIGAVVAIRAFSEITDTLGVPDYVTSFFVLSVGTSLPELLVAGRALLKGAGDLALGDIMGSSLYDSTLSLGIGPFFFPTLVSDAAASGTLIVAGVVALAVTVLLLRRVHRRPSGFALIALYLALFPLLLAQT